MIKPVTWKGAAGREASRPHSANGGEALITLGRIQSRLAAAHAGLPRRFDAGSDHDADGYPTTAAWLAGKTQQSRRDARAAVRQMRLLGG